MQRGNGRIMPYTRDWMGRHKVGLGIRLFNQTLPNVYSYAMYIPSFPST